ncbi:hypothetical protein [Microbacterium sp. W4I20]|uniref:hypothetical protein n=1 Tax=Microbacterium sp. W4I20 TaxID=3042262 RepID=UPI00278856A6|nr:hypothetical protein [Microbacterium sp. W4I20]MDQ0726331.1 hypothetical protein [Microbacterium sp. W4I20]
MSASFVEVTSPAWSFWRACVDTCIGLIVGTLYAFAGILVMGIVGEEALSSQYEQIDLDPVFRASMGVILLAGAVLGIGVPLIATAERLAAFHAAEASARENPDGVPQRRLRLSLAKSPFALLQTTGTTIFWVLVGLGVIFAIGLLFTEDLREDAVSWIALAVMGAIALAGWLLRIAGRRGVRSTSSRLGQLNARWQRLVPEANAADARRRDAAVRVAPPAWLTVPTARTLAKVAAVLTTATFVALGAFMLSVYMRQQCRTCDPVYWDEPIENGIDVLSLASGIALAACAAIAVIAWIGGVVLQAVREVALVRWLSSDAPRRISPVLLTPLVSGTRAMVRLQYGLSAVAASVIVIATGVVWADADLFDADAALIAAVGLIVVALLLGWTDAGRSRRERQAIRDRAFPGDLDSPAKGDPTADSAKRGKRPRRMRRR